MWGAYQRRKPRILASAVVMLGRCGSSRFCYLCFAIYVCRSSAAFVSGQMSSSYNQLTMYFYAVAILRIWFGSCLFRLRLRLFIRGRDDHFPTIQHGSKVVGSSPADDAAEHATPALARFRVFRVFRRAWIAARRNLFWHCFITIARRG